MACQCYQRIRRTRGPIVAPPRSNSSLVACPFSLITDDVVHNNQHRHDIPSQKLARHHRKRSPVLLHRISNYIITSTSAFQNSAFQKNLAYALLCTQLKLYCIGVFARLLKQITGKCDAHKHAVNIHTRTPTHEPLPLHDSLLGHGKLTSHHPSIRGAIGLRALNLSKRNHGSQLF